MAAQPKTIANDIGQDIAELINSGLLFSPDDERILELESRAKKLARVSPGTAYIDLAAAAMLCGNYAKMEERRRIAFDNGADFGDKTNFGTVLIHAGFYSEAAAIFKRALDKIEDVEFATTKALLGMQFQLFSTLTQKLNRMHPEGLYSRLSKEDQIEYLGFSKLLMEMQLDDSTMANIMDMAGHVLRNHKIYFKSAGELLSAVNSEEERRIICTLRIPQSCSKASDMTIEFADRYLASEYAEFADRFMVRFAGEQLA